MIIVVGRNYKVYLHKIIEEKPFQKASLFFSDKLKSISLPKRRNEIITTGYILNYVFRGDIPVIDYDDSGKPFFVNNDLKISISHCNDWGAVGISNKEVLIGIDIENVSPKPLKLRSKFINKEDERFFVELTNESATLIWTIKEAVYKLDNAFVNFKDDILINSLTKISKFRGVTVVNDSIDVEYFIFDNFILSVATKIL
jgi:4'-phosphopantetheinyl transferase EntD